jgi:hypothetical protein
MTLTLWPLTSEFDLLFKNFNLGHNLWLVGDRAFIFHTCIPYGKTFFIWYHDLDPLTFEFDKLKNFNLVNNFWLVGARAFIFDMCTPYGKTFHLIPWPWPSDLWHWSLTYFLKTLSLVVTFDWWVVGVSYFTWIFVVVRPFFWYHDFDFLTFDLRVWPIFQKL